MFALLIRGLETANEILSAGILITSASLLLYSLTFNLRDRVARSFSLILVYVTVVFLGELAAGASDAANMVASWLRFQWMGIAYIPVGYLHFADALLATTGQPSRGRRRIAIRLLYGVSTLFMLLAVLSDTVVRGPAQVAPGPAPHLRPGPLFWLFALYSLAAAVIGALYVWRAYRRCLTATTRRRMGYILLASTAPALGTFPYWLLGSNIVPSPLLFWSASISINLLVGALLTLMAYAVAFFGVNQPDRVVKRRLLHWFLRGPVVVSTALTVIVLVSRYTALAGLQENLAVPFFLVATLLLLQFLITLIRSPLERLFFYDKDEEDARRLQMLEDRMLTASDLRQFLESVLAAICDQLRISSAFVAASGSNGLELEVTVGPDGPIRNSDHLPPPAVPPAGSPAGGPGGFFQWEDYWLLLLHDRNAKEVTGLLGLRARSPAPDFTPDEKVILELLIGRISAALEDKKLQREVFGALDNLIPQIDQIQRLRAAARFSGAAALTSANGVPPDVDLAQVVKDALTHYWGGPRLTNSPLMGLKVVKKALREHDGNAVNALRAILRQAIEHTRPQGERRFTAEWILYNLLELKFLEGRKVRQVALRLAVSEADLYRKQKVAIEQVARAIEDMEHSAAGQI